MTEVQTQHSVGTWGRKTFGAQSLAEIARLAANEMSELRAALEADPECRLESTQAEAADVLLFLYRLAHEAGFSLMTAGDRKMKVNRTRRWTRNEDGTFTKVREVVS